MKKFLKGLAEIVTIVALLNLCKDIMVLCTSATRYIRVSEAEPLLAVIISIVCIALSLAVAIAWGHYLWFIASNDKT